MYLNKLRSLKMFHFCWFTTILLCKISYLEYVAIFFKNIINFEGFYSQFSYRAWSNSTKWKLEKRKVWSKLHKRCVILSLNFRKSYRKVPKQWIFLVVPRSRQCNARLYMLGWLTKPIQILIQTKLVTVLWLLYSW